MLGIIVAMGLWGDVVGEAGVAAPVVTAIAFGIIVDDTIHFMTKYMRPGRAGGYRPSLFNPPFVRWARR
ncbi:MAG: hypothetical protein OXG56_09895 [Gammaproteobacteria bacterium]|nr:hypothetical protein [Gammaproteobacteria bacterium]